jgi:hypothetical protein
MRKTYLCIVVAFVGCAGEIDDGEEWFDSTTQEVSCAAEPKLASAKEVVAGFAWTAQDRVVADLSGGFYVVDAAGDLWRTRSGMATKIAEGWGEHRVVLAAGEGVLYTVDAAGALHWWRHFDSDEGELLWDEQSGRAIADGFDRFTQIVSGGDGVIYTADAEGQLRWYLHLDPDDGEAEWAEGSGQVIASDFAFDAITSAGDGVLYGAKNGEVRMFRHLDPVEGAPGFADGAGQVVAQGMDTMVGYTPSCDAESLRAALVHWGMFPAASDAYRATGLAASRITQTIGNAPASAGYHARDGYANGQPYCAATDISTRGLSLTFIRRLLERMGRLGFAAFYRRPGYDGWPSSQVAHIHAVYAGAHMKSQLRGQVTDWLSGRNGLASHGPYRFFTPSAAAKAKVRCLFGLGCSSGGGGGSTGGSCVSGGFYCGGDKVSGDRNTLYRCNGSSATTVISRCAVGCSVNSGRDDSCRPAGSCVKGGLYCGGDKLNGHPSVLYRCNGSSAPTVASRCANGCVVAPAGSDDHCR